MIIKQTQDTLSTIYQDAVAIRQEVFVKGQGVPKDMEIDEYETLAIHFVLYDQEHQACATCRLLPSQDKTTITLQRMAVLDSYQGQGLGKKLLKHALEYATKAGFDKMTMHAQLTAQPFYQKLGFQTQGERFEEAGITHITMTKSLG
ncbi:GNAT family N-acetyltransferase [Streptococcus sp. zg-JUN1979]|uniref:GNAT family N-acetyltransferase n=1 Tax=Streptococcus sp. zg-JUN1979 TaxID=3391450 RepID=UPI0039A5185D